MDRPPSASADLEASKGRENMLGRLTTELARIEKRDADLWVVPQESYGAALIAWTGDKAHNIHLRTIAKKKGFMLDDFGLFKKTKSVAGATEASVYTKLGMAFIPPEIRSDSGEIEAAMKHELPALIGYNDIKGDLQVQTDWTDGQESILTMAKSARSLGLEYIAITDHTKSLTVAKGLDVARLRKQWAEIDRVQKQLTGIRILKGTECDIKKDGSLDLPDDVLAELDVVGISVHSHFEMPEREQTARIIRAMQNPYSDIMFHPTGRIIGRRPGYAVDMRVVLQGLAPGVQDRQEADLGPEMCGIRGNRTQGFCRRTKQDVIDDPFVLVGNGGDLLGDGKHDVEILRLQELCPPLV